MKRISTIITLFTVCFMYSIATLAQQTFYVYRNDGVMNQFIIADVESIEFCVVESDGTGNEDYITQEIHTIDSICRIPLSLIDSVSFSAPDPAKSIHDTYIGIDWNNTTLLSCNTETGDYSLLFSGADPNIKEESVIVLETDSTSFIVLVTNVSKNGNVYNIKGELGDLTNLFYDTEFTISTEGDSPEPTRYHLPMYSTKRKSIEIDDDGTIRATGRLWNHEIEEQIDLYKKGSTHAYTKSKFGLNFDYEVYLRFGDKEIVEIAGKKFFAAKSFYIDTKIKGDMNSSVDLYIDAENETTFDLAPNETDKYVLLKHKLFPSIPLKIPVGPVVIPVDLGVDLFADVSLKGGGEFHFNAGCGAKATAMIGTRYDGNVNNNITPYYDRPDVQIVPHDPTVSGKGWISGKVHVFPRIHAWVGGLAGPSIDFKPFLRADLSGGYQKDLLQDASSDYCAWSLETFGGMDIAVGLSRSSWNYEVWNKSTKDIKVFEYNLYKSPVDIQFLSASPDFVKKGKNTEVKFVVYDKGFDGNEVTTPLPQLIKFEGAGIIDATVGTYGIANSGVVTASWTPSSATDILFARMYDISGNIIAEAQYFKEGVDTLPAKITNFEQNSATFTRDGFEYKGKTYYYDFAATTTVELENSEGVVDWGYVYIDPYGEADTISVVGLGENPANDPRYHYYRGIPNATATLYGYSKYADGTFVFDEPKDYPLEYIFHPSAYVGDVIADSITSTSVQFEFGFNDVPRTGKCFTAVQSARDNEPIVREVSFAVKDTVKFADLFPGTTYEYWAYVEYAGVTYASDKKSLTTLTPTAHVEQANDDKVTMTSAEICYGFANVPENAKCYVGISAKVQTIAGDGEEINKSYSQTFPVENTTGATYEFNGLYPSTTYTYYAYVEYEGGTWYSDGEKFTTKAPPTPVATTGDCSNVTTNTAKVSCSFENVPEGGVCGVEYTWSNGSKKQSIGNVNGTQTITLSGLESGTAYSYCAYVEAYGQTYYGEEKSFNTKNEIPDITGVWNCKEFQNGTQTGEATFELKADGAASSTTISGSGGYSRNSTGHWSINDEGYVNIQFSWQGFSGGDWKSYGGTINSFVNPTQIEGTANYTYVGNMGGGYQQFYQFVMTR